MRCSSCNKPRNELFPKQSELLKGMTLYMCNTCITAKMEPKWIIILAARRDGPDSVRDYIVKRRYHGDTIEGQEIVK